MATAKETTANFKFVLPRTDQTGWQDDFYNNFRSIDGVLTRFFQIANFRGVWDNSVSYSTGDRALDPDQSIIYEAQSDHVSPVSGTFADAREANPSLWESTALTATNVGTWQQGADYGPNQFLKDGNRYGITTETFTSGSSYDNDVSSGRIITLIDLTSDLNDAATFASNASDSADLAEDWATETASDVNGTGEYSAKEYAQGTQAGTGGSAKDWSIETSSDVDGVDYSSKEYAQGSQAGTGGSSKTWATNTGSDVDGTGEYAAKEYAQGDLEATGGSAKAWAIDASSPDGTTAKSAKSYADDAATSASNAATSESNAATSATTAQNAAEAVSASGLAIPYDIELADTADSDPGAGLIKFNNATQNAATELYASNTDNDSIDVTALLGQLDSSTSTVKGQLSIRRRTDRSEWLIYEVTNVVDNGTYSTITVSTIDSSGAAPFSDTDAVVLGFTRSGDAGTGDVNGPGSSTDNALARFDGTSGVTIQNSGATLDDNDILTLPGARAGQTDKGTNSTGGATITFDLNDGSKQKLTVAANTTIAFSNFPSSGTYAEVEIEAVNWGSATITFPTINWYIGDGTTSTTFVDMGVTLASSGTNHIVVWSTDGGTTLYGVAQ